MHALEEPCRFNEQSSGPTQPSSPAPADGQAAAPGDPEFVGQTLGNFRLTRVLGVGGMGTVYLGEHVVIGSKVAVKVLHGHLATDRTLVERFFAEARAVNLAGHENIVSIFDMGMMPPNRHYLIMEYLEGLPVSAQIGGPLDLEFVHQVLSQTCDALSAAHAASVIHRDLKPENVFVTRRGGKVHVKLVDFGIAKLQTAGTAQTSAGLVVGTPEFMAPEQWTGAELDGRADLYALGLIAYGMVTGVLPFGGSMMELFLAHSQTPPLPPSARNPLVPAALERVIMRALAKKREDRFENAQAMKAAVDEAFGAGSKAKTPPPLAQTVHVAPAPAHERVPASVEVDVEISGRAMRLSSADLSKGGMFLKLDGALPPLFSRLRLSIAAPRQPLTTEAEVIRHVSPEQAHAWGMSPGFAVQFVEAPAAFRTGIERLLKGMPLTTPERPAQGPVRPQGVVDDARAEEVLSFYRKRISGDHYALLGLNPDAETGDIRQRARQATRELEALRHRPLSPVQKEQVEAALSRVAAAVAALSMPAKRIEYDAHRGNFRGVARCVAAGLPKKEIDELRKRFLADRPGKEGKARLEAMAGDSLASSGQIELALQKFEVALSVDPLNLELHGRYWSLMRRRVDAR